MRRPAPPISPEYSARARIARGGDAAQSALLWVVIAAAVIGLGAVTLRLARAEGTKSA